MVECECPTLYPGNGAKETDCPPASASQKIPEDTRGAGKLRHPETTVFTNCSERLLRHVAVVLQVIHKLRHIIIIMCGAKFSFEIAEKWSSVSL